jgi:hypothetical protein
MRTGLVAVLVLATTTVAVATPSLTVSATSAGGALDLDGKGSSTSHIVKIADVTLSTDAAGGVTISLASGHLSKADGRTAISFQVLLVPNDAAAPSAAAFTTPSGTTYQWSSTGAGTFVKDLYIRYQPAALQDPGDYTASVDIDVVDN